MRKYKITVYRHDNFEHHIVGVNMFDDYGLVNSMMNLNIFLKDIFKIELIMEGETIDHTVE